MRWLEQHATKKTRDGMARFGIPSTNALGVTVGDMRKYAKTIGKDHALAERLWKTGVYEARFMAAFVDDPAAVTPAQMEKWAGDFDNWAVCDTVCFALFDRTPHAWKKVHAWAGARPEFKRRGAFALLWALSVHDKRAPDALFLACLPLIEARRARRARLREEGRRHGAARDGQAQPEAPPRGDRAGDAPARFE